MATVSTFIIRLPRVTGLPLIGMVRTSFWGLSDQALISATNFLTIVLLARSLSHDAFGYFTLAYTALQFAGSLQAALITQPHNVLGATRHGEDYIRYTTSTAFSQLLATLVIMVGVAVAGALIQISGWEIAPLLFALAPAIGAWQLQEFIRRVLYTEGRLAAAFLNDLLSYGGQTAVIAVLWYRDLLSGPVALYALAGTSAVAAGVGVWQLHGRFARYIDTGVLHENWRFGKWLAGAEIGHWLSAPLYMYLAAAILGAAAAGELKAAQMLLGPLNILIFFLDSVLPMRFARALKSGGQLALHSQLKIAYLVTAPVFGGYCFLVVVLAGPLLQLVYGASYAGSTPLVVLYAAYYMVLYLVQIVSSALRAQQLTRHIFTAHVYSSLIAVFLGWLFIRTLGAEGAVLGLILSALAVNFLYWLAYSREVASSPPSPIRGRGEEA